MKKLLSLTLVFAMLCALLTAFTVTGAAVAEEKTVANNSPAITADVGEQIDLSQYKVVFDGDTSATGGITWKNGDTTVTKFTPSAKGVTALTASAGGKTKTVYVVAKNASEKEYVLFEDDFTGYSSTADVVAAGYSKINGDMDLKDGYLEYGNTTGLYNEGRILLPAWLGDFGNYSLCANLKMTVANGRWFGPVYRISNANGSYYPYYHSCIRMNTTNNGLEFGGRNVNNGWSVMSTCAGTIADMSAAYHDIALTAYNDTFQLIVDGEEMIYITQSDLMSIAAADSSRPWVRIDKGYLGFIASGTKVALNKVKVVLQAGEIAHIEKKSELLNISHDETNVINPLANIQSLSGKDAYTAVLNGENAPSGILVGADEISDYKAFFKACEKSVAIPNISVSSKAQIDSICTAANDAGFNDITMISADASLLKYARDKNNLIRTGLKIQLANDSLSSKEAEAVRKQVRGAPATFCVIGTEHATVYNVHELQALALAVWVEADISDKADTLKAVTSGANAVITSDSAAFTALINENFAERTMTRVPILIGHRGNPTQAPENSLASFEAAMKNGADVFEIDVEITKDGHIVIMHDNTIDRTTNGSGSVNSLTLEQIKSYNLIYDVAIGSHKVGEVSDQKVPTLEEVLDLLKKYPNCRMFIEFKGSNANNIPATSKIVKKYGMEDRVDVISFNAAFLSQTQQSANMPGMSTGLLGSTQGSSAVYSEAIDNFYKSYRVAQIYNSTINNSGVSYLPFMTVANDRGFTVWPWTYTYGSNNGAFFVGAAGITTNDVQWAKDMYKFVSHNDVLMESGKTYELKAAAETFSHADVAIKASNLIVKVISGSDVVSVSNGKITSLKNGTAKLLVGVSTRTKSGSNYVLYAQPVTVTVADVEGIAFQPGTAYTVDKEKSYILGIYPDTSLDAFKQQAVNAYDYTFENLGDKNLVGTGTKVTCGGTTSTLVVKGDVDGSGHIDVADYIMVKRAYLRNYTLSDIQLRAAALSDGEEVQISDYIMIKRKALGNFEFR